ncbi:hypothetical protein JTB14_004837 [Gonioctena quinquepunctata]|nr:hypothetical protein JTB14_004837 [Gonioctena quinquepunctata]
MEQCEAYLRGFTGLRLQVGKLLLKPVDEQSVDGDTGEKSPYNSSRDIEKGNINASQNDELDTSLENRPENLLRFVGSEVENEVRIVLASESFGLTNSAVTTEMSDILLREK